MKRIHLLWLCLALTACNLPTSAPQGGSSIATAAAQTVEAALSVVPLPSATLAASTVTPTVCDDQLLLTEWLRDGVLFDVKEVEKRIAPNDSFNMTWKVKNNGACVWNDTYKLVFESGTRLTKQDSLPIMPKGYQVRSGEELTISALLTAPSDPGTYDTSFSLVNGEGKDLLTVGVTTNVGTASTSSLSAPGDLRYTYDCTSGTVNVGLFWVDKSSDEDGFRIYRDGAKIGETGAGSTSYQDTAPTTGKFKYTVASFNASGESPASVKVETLNCQ